MTIEHPRNRPEPKDQDSHPAREPKQPLPEFDRNYFKTDAPIGQDIYGTLLGKEVRAIVVLKQPLIVMISDVVSSTEAAEIMKLADSRLEQSRAVSAWGVDEALGEEQIRTSSSAFLGKSENELIRTVEQRLSHLTAIPSEHGEPLQVVRYLPGQEFKEHHDAYPLDIPSIETAMALATGGQRTLTVLIYLNTLEREDEGLTCFPNLGRRGLTLRPREGAALLFENLSEDGSQHPAVIHAGAPTKVSTKYAINAWFRENPCIDLPFDRPEQLASAIQDRAKNNPRLREVLDAMNLGDKRS